MLKKHFAKLLDEKQFRNVDPFELQVFKEQQSSKLKDLEDMLKSKHQLEMTPLDSISVAPSIEYKGYNKQK